MIYMGVDPGRTTGITFVELMDNGLHPSYSTETHLDDLFKVVSGLLDHYRKKHLFGGVEEVIRGGQLNVDKYDQIRAYTIATELFKSRGVRYHEVTPHQRAVLEKFIIVPDSIHGNHARDAYRIAAITFERRSGIDNDRPETKESKHHARQIFD